jgi:hypothetical protein
MHSFFVACACLRSRLALVRLALDSCVVCLDLCRLLGLGVACVAMRFFSLVLALARAQTHDVFGLHREAIDHAS